MLSWRSRQICSPIECPRKLEVPNKTKKTRCLLKQLSDTVRFGQRHMPPPQKTQNPNSDTATHPLNSQCGKVLLIHSVKTQSAPGLGASCPKVFPHNSQIWSWQDGKTKTTQNKDVRENKLCWEQRRKEGINHPCQRPGRRASLWGPLKYHLPCVFTDPVLGIHSLPKEASDEYFFLLLPKLRPQFILRCFFFTAPETIQVVFN